LNILSDASSNILLGPIVQITIGPYFEDPKDSDNQARALATVPVTAIIAPSLTRSVINRRVSLALRPNYRRGRFGTLLLEPKDRNVAELELTFVAQLSEEREEKHLIYPIMALVVDTIYCPEYDNIQCMLGRDVLQHGGFVYHGSMYQRETMEEMYSLSF